MMGNEAACVAARALEEDDGGGWAGARLLG
jgi:hypothetical protein